MKKNVFCLMAGLFGMLIVGGLTSCNTSKQSSGSHKKGWVSIFNGKSLSGWHTFQKQEADPCWQVSNGAIVLNHSAGKGGGDLVSDKTYSNFILTLSWKISTGGNSGIIFDAQEDPQYKATYVTGPEMQVLDNKKASDNKKANHLAGSLYDLLPCDPSTVNPAGEWNKVKIEQNNGHLTFWMNGHKVVETQLWTPEWKEMIAHSKFKNWSTFGTFHEGHIALQDHGHEVWYKDIKVKEL